MAKARVLVVDDEPSFRRLIRDMLERANCDVEDVGDGLDGLAKAAALQPDVILLDLMMPAVDGYEVCRRLKTLPATRTIPVIFLTASRDLRLNREAYTAGAAACLTKPFRNEALLAVLHATLTAGRRKDAGARR